MRAGNGNLDCRYEFESLQDIFITMRMGNVYKELSVDREHGRVMNDFQDTPILKGCKKEEKHAKELSAS